MRQIEEHKIEFSNHKYKMKELVKKARRIKKKKDLLNKVTSSQISKDNLGGSPLKIKLASTSFQDKVRNSFMKSFVLKALKVNPSALYSKDRIYLFVL